MTQPGALRSLQRRFGLRDLTRHKAVNASLAALLTLSAFLLATGGLVMERTVSAVNGLFEQAQPPHFLQMHTGEYDVAALEAFAASHPELDAWLIEDMLGYDGAAMTWSRPGTSEGGDLSDSLIDNLLVTQNTEFDFLVAADGTIPTPSAGEIYVPVAYQQQFGLRAGDEVGISTGEGVLTLTVMGFVRDAQMASSLSSATRFLVSEEDFADLAAAGGGAEEIIVEYRLTDTADIAALQRAYAADDALPQSGQAVTYDQIRLINAFSDGLVAFALMFCSALLVTIAFLSLRFVIRGTLEDEVRQIGVMKAIGLPQRTIAGLYLGRFRLLTIAGCVLGGLLAFPATVFLTATVQASYAVVGWSWISVLVLVVAVAAVYLVVIGLCRRVLRGLRRVDVVGALVHGSTRSAGQTARASANAARRARRTSLAGGHGSLTARLAWLDLRAEAGQWLLVPIVFALVALLITLPMNLYTTFASPQFVTYLGAPASDLRFDLAFSEDVDQSRESLLATLSSDDQITGYQAYATVLYDVEGPEGWESFKVEVGDYSGPTVEFVDGGAPTDGEIALSVQNAAAYGLGVGDQLALREGTSEVLLNVSGTYQDVTAGGFTAKVQGEVTTGAAGYVIYATTADGADPAAVAATYNDRYPTVDAVAMGDYVTQTLSYVTGALRSATVLALGFGIAVAALLTTLFLTLRLARERPRMGVLAALGFSGREIGAQVRFKTAVMVAVGTAAGVVLAATGGERLVGGLIALGGLGISQLAFIPNPWLVYLAIPLMLFAAGYIAAMVLTASLPSADKSAWLRA